MDTIFKRLRKILNRNIVSIVNIDFTISTIIICATMSNDNDNIECSIAD